MECHLCNKPLLVVDTHRDADGHAIEAYDERPAHILEHMSSEVRGASGLLLRMTPSDRLTVMGAFCNQCGGLIGAGTCHC